MQTIKFVVILGLISIGFQAVAASPCEKESVPWLETVDIEEGCTAGKILRYQCKDCTCEEEGKTATCPKWIKCCKLGDIWSTNNCNMCYCNEKYQRICKAIPCHRRS